MAKATGARYIAKRKPGAGSRMTFTRRLVLGGSSGHLKTGAVSKHKVAKRKRSGRLYYP
jgi:hypothetical protein